MISPSSLAVRALKFLQKSMMLIPWGPSAGPTGGAGVALPAAIWSFTCVCTFFGGAILQISLFGILEFHFRGGRSHLKASGHFLNLSKFKLDGRRPTEDRDHDLQGLPV